MNIYRLYIQSVSIAYLFCLLCSCSARRPYVPSLDEQSSKNLAVAGSDSIKRHQFGTERTFTNINVVMWVPSDAERIWDGPTSSVKIGRITPPHVLPEEYKIEVEIQTFTEQEFKRNAELGDDWYFQEHLVLAMREMPAGKQFRKDIHDPGRGRILSVNAAIAKDEASAEDVETAKKIIESIKLITNAETGVPAHEK